MGLSGCWSWFPTWGGRHPPHSLSALPCPGSYVSGLSGLVQSATAVPLPLLLFPCSDQTSPSNIVPQLCPASWVHWAEWDRWGHYACELRTSAWQTCCPYPTCITVNMQAPPYLLF
jgi:hypothetical protein